jgi:hypothetical protein
MFTKLGTVLGFGLALMGSIAFAQEVPKARDAQKQLFKVGKRAVELKVLRPDLVPDNYKAALETAVGIQKYYEAMAASPSEGMLASSATLAVNYHSAETAGVAAIAGCNAKKKEESEPCVVIAEFLPKGYDGPRAFSLSFNATEAFRKYRRAGKPKAFAISPATGEWGQAVKAGSIAAADQAALAACAVLAAKKEAGDCRIVSRD